MDILSIRRFTECPESFRLLVGDDEGSLFRLFISSISEKYIFRLFDFTYSF
jgi:hypothetical protein